MTVHFLSSSWCFLIRHIRLPVNTPASGALGLTFFLLSWALES